jgi:hypothetical protein
MTLNFTVPKSARLRTRTKTALSFGATYDSASVSSRFSALPGVPTASNRQTEQANQLNSIEAFIEQSFPLGSAPSNDIAV